MVVMDDLGDKARNADLGVQGVLAYLYHSILEVIVISSSKSPATVDRVGALEKKQPIVGNFVNEGCIKSHEQFRSMSRNCPGGQIHDRL